jgi:hypothetical protein
VRVPTSTSRALLRCAVAVAIGVGASYVAWQHIGTHLHVTTDIVGRTTFADFDVYRYIYRFYDVTLVLPAATTLAYVLLSRFGPLRSPPAARPWPPGLEETEPISDGSPADVVPHRIGNSDDISRRQLLWAVTRVGIPAFAVGIEANVAHSLRVAALTRFSVATALLYALAVSLVTIALGLRRRRSSPEHEPAAGASLSQSIAMDLPVVNALASVVVIPLLVLVSSSTTVTVVANGNVVHYPWFPAWLGALVTVVVLVVLVRAILHAQDAKGRLLIERRTLLIVVVPILLFMVTAGIQGAQGPFSGFDDAQAMVGARLSFGHGLWPWRNLFLLHGFLADDLYGGVGLWVLSATRWGSNSGVSLFVVPLTIVALYGFIVYFARRNTLLIVAGTLALVLGLLPGWAGTRYVLLPVALILFDRVLRHGTWNRCLLLMVSAVLFSIITPEGTLLMLGILVTLVAAETIHRPRRERLVKSFSRTIRCAVTGAGLVAGWIVFLLATGSFSGFVAYYQTTVSGHELWGAFSPQWSLTGDPWATIQFALPIALFLMTIAKVVGKLTRRAPWRPTEWVLVASSTPVLLFYQVALDRMDYGHVDEVFQTLIPFVVLWAMEIVRFADSKVSQAGNWLVRRRSATLTFPIAVPVTVLAVIAIAAGSPTTLASWKDVPAEFHAVSTLAAPSNLPLGYTQPGAVDTAQITDLGKVLDRYAGKNGPVFDFTNEMGITYFLLNRVPGARFYHVESAQTAEAQNLEVSDLEHSRPRIVIFNDKTFGLPDYDGIFSMERNYIVSQYLLDHYRALLDTHGQLILLRNDLFKEADPLPRLSTPPATAGLYFDLPTCDWGDVPNFLIHPTPDAASAGLDLRVDATGTEKLVSVQGWAFDTADDEPAKQVLVVSGDRVVSSSHPTAPRPDVAAALHSRDAAKSGFEAQFSLTTGASYRIYALNVDGSVTPLASASSSAAQGPTPQSVTTPDGTVHAVRISPSDGHVDTTSVSKEFSLTVPAGTDLSSYDWMEVRSPTDLGSSRIQVTDSIQGGPSHVIAWSTLPGIGTSVFTRVGSCLQWHGYSTRTLTMLVSGPPTSFSVRIIK